MRMALVRGVTRGKQTVEVERPCAVGKIHRHFHGHRALQAQGPGIVGPGGRGDDDLIAVCRNHLDGVLDRLHAATSDEEVLGI